jgi:hypothetical protein
MSRQSAPSSSYQGDGGWVTSLWLGVWGSVREVLDLGEAVSVNGIDTFCGLSA